MASKLGTLSKSIKGSVTLITGSKSGDLGGATLAHFLKNKSKCVVFDLPKAYTGPPPVTENCVFAQGDIRNEEQVASLMKLCKEKYGRLDNIRNEEQMASLMKLCKEKYGRLDNVINCAGIHTAVRTYSPKHEVPCDLDILENMLDVNVCGLFNVIKHSVELMKDNEPDEDGNRGTIVNVGGAAATCGMAGQVLISACEGAVASMTLPLSRDLAEVGIRVVTIAPGLMESSINDGIKQRTIQMQKSMHIFPRRFGDPTEFAALCQSVCENPMINGEVIGLDAAARYPH